MAALDDLTRTRPYVSLVLARYTATSGVGQIVNSVVGDLKTELKLSDDDSTRILLGEEADTADAGLRRAFVHYTEERPRAG